MYTLLLILLVLLLLGGLPIWQIHPYGYAPSSAAATLLVVLLVLLLVGWL